MTTADPAQIERETAERQRKIDADLRAARAASPGFCINRFNWDSYQEKKRKACLRLQLIEEDD